MKEFGVYTLKPSFLKEYQGVANKLSEMKLTKRPFVCVKIKDGGEMRNWLIPLSSINPDSLDYVDRLRKQNAFNALDKRSKPCAMDIFDDLLKEGKKGYKDVAWYYEAIPVKGKYCAPYRDKNNDRMEVDRAIGTKMRQRLIDYLQATKGNNDVYVGFIKVQISSGKTNFQNYPIDQQALRAAVYKKHNALIKVRIQKRQEHERFEREQQRRRDIKQRYKEVEGELVAAAIDQSDESKEHMRQKEGRGDPPENQ